MEAQGRMCFHPSTVEDVPLWQSQKHRHKKHVTQPCPKDYSLTTIYTVENAAALQVPKPSCRQWNRLSASPRVTLMMDYINGGTVSINGGV